MQLFLESLRAAFDEAVAGDKTYAPLVAGWFASLNGLQEPATAKPAALPACRHLDSAISRIQADIDRSDAPAGDSASGHASSATCIRLARAVAALAPSLAWYRRAGSESHGPAFHSGHANAFVAGSSRAEDRHQPAIGVSLLGPAIRYPDHHHAPEELYLVLSPGHWRHGASSWFQPGIGGVVHNTPGIVHAMRSGPEPLLAIWCLFAEPRSDNRSASVPGSGPSLVQTATHGSN